MACAQEDVDKELETQGQQLKDIQLIDDEDDFDDEGEENVDLGFAIAMPDAFEPILHQHGNWKDWDGGKIGGKPIWLNPKQLPSKEETTCGFCQVPMTFLLQIYCPLDDVPQAFHRSLYLFCCRQGSCVSKGSLQVLRCQLPRENAFYESSSGTRELKAPELAAKTCALCNLSASASCSQCKKVSYCCKLHQKDHWKNGHKQDCTDCMNGKESKTACHLRDQGSMWTFPERQIYIDYEPDISETVTDYEQKLIDDFKTADATRDDGDDPFTNKSEIDISQSELHQLLGSSEQDKTHLAFLSRTSVAKDQILRYARWGDGSPLWVQSQHIPEVATDVPTCELCGGLREFEFQVMPQLLYYLKVHEDESLTTFDSDLFDWGTLAVYTCRASCAYDIETKGYVKEFLWLQPSSSDKVERKQSAAASSAVNEE